MTYNERKELGVCVRCSDIAVNGTCFCQKHIDHNNTKQREYRKQKKDSGICLSCKLPATKGVYCEFHKEYFNKKGREYIVRKKELNICTCCELPATNGPYCVTHHIRYKAFDAKRKQKRKDTGKCVTCGIDLTLTKEFQNTYNCINCSTRSLYFTWR
jgi:hypothetical protein